MTVSIGSGTSQAMCVTQPLIMSTILGRGSKLPYSDNIDNDLFNTGNSQRQKEKMTRGCDDTRVTIIGINGEAGSVHVVGRKLLLIRCSLTCLF